MTHIRGHRIDDVEDSDRHERGLTSVPEWTDSAIAQQVSSVAEQTEKSAAITCGTDNLSGEVIDFKRACEFGTFVHLGYESACYDHFDDVASEVDVRIQGGQEREFEWGRIDTIIDEKYIFDFKTHHMKDWTEQDATHYGHEHGAKVKAYVDSPDTPADAEGWIIATDPPDSPNVRKTYSDIVGDYGIGVKFSKSEQQDEVIAAIEDAIEDARDGTGEDEEEFRMAN